MTEQEQYAMHLPQAQAGWERWNINTIVLLGGFALTLGGLVVSSGMFIQRSNYLETRVESLEVQVRKIDTMDYRLTAAENSGASVSRSLDELRAAVAQQSGDLKVVREILQRLESQSKAAVFDLGKVPSIARASAD